MRVVSTVATALVVVAASPAATVAAGTAIKTVATSDATHCTAARVAGPKQPARVPARTWDFNGDGREDVAILPIRREGQNGAETAHVLYSNRRGLPTCEQVLPIPEPSILGLVAGGDLDGNGRSDLIVSNPGTGNSSALQIYYGQRHGLVGLTPQHIRYPFPYAGRSVLAADFNDDGYDDLAVGLPQPDPGAPGLTTNKYGVIRIYWGGKHGIDRARTTAIKPPNHKTTEFGLQLLVGNFNGDRYPDLVETYQATASPPQYPLEISRTLYFPGSSDGPSAGTKIAPFSGSWAVGDLNHDGIDDLLMSQPHGLEEFDGSATGLRPPVAIPEVAKRPYVGELLDVDHDGWLDAIMQDPLGTAGGHKYAGRIEVVRGSPHGFRVQHPLRISLATRGVPGCAHYAADFGLWLQARHLTGSRHRQLVVENSGGSAKCARPRLVRFMTGRHGLDAAATYYVTGEKRGIGRWFYTQAAAIG